MQDVPVGEVSPGGGLQGVPCQHSTEEEELQVQELGVQGFSGGEVQFGEGVHSHSRNAGGVSGGRRREGKRSYRGRGGVGPKGRKGRRG
mgnify:CR=1 FL=1